MKNSLKRKVIALSVIALSVLIAACSGPANEKKIGIIVPLEHKAMNEIVDGFSETLRAQSPYPVKIKVANAQGDMNIQRAIIQQMKDENFDIIVPVGTTTTQMTVAAIKQQPIVGIATMMSQQERSKIKSCHVSVVHDEISSEQLIQFVHLVYPKLTSIVLIHSALDKIFPEVDAAVTAGKKLGITVKPIMVTSLSELTSATNAIPDDSQGILVLKDSLIVSGISTLESTAEKRHIPLITSDQGSVQDGSAFALGVHERDIGVEGAKLAAAILSGKQPCNIPIVDMTKLVIFVNKDSLIKENQSLAPIENVAKNNGYKIEPVKSASGK